jgi:hypothetical protein
MDDVNRKTTIPVKKDPPMVQWLLENCSSDELSFMASIGLDATKTGALLSIINRLIDYNMATVFYSKTNDAKTLLTVRAGKLGEVAAFKSFYLACKSAKESLVEKQKKNI